MDKRKIRENSTTQILIKTLGLDDSRKMLAKVRDVQRIPRAQQKCKNIRESLRLEIHEQQVRLETTCKQTKRHYTKAYLAGTLIHSLL